MEKRLVYRVPDVARLLGTTESAVRRMIQTGAIPSRRLGRRVIILPDELEALLGSLKKPREAQDDGKSYRMALLSPRKTRSDKGSSRKSHKPRSGQNNHK